VAASSGFRQRLIRRLPAEWLDTASTQSGWTQAIVLPDGERLDALIVPLEAEGVSLVTMSPSFRCHPLETPAALLVAVLVYLAASLTASWITDTLVLHWLERLRLRLADMRASVPDAQMGAEFAGAPFELQQLGTAFDVLMERCTRQASDLQKALVTSTAAFRETHHRVRNNLQVMLSMLKLQVRNETAPETCLALRLAAQRVSMMAAVQDSLFNGSNLMMVDAVELINAICTQIEDQQSRGEDSRTIRPEVSPGLLASDIAVPLAMFILEAVHLICPVSENGAVTHDFQLCLTREERYVRLQLSCGRIDAADIAAPNGANTSLFLAAFARQMGGSVERLGHDPETIIIQLLIPVENIFRDWPVLAP